MLVELLTVLVLPCVALLLSWKLWTQYYTWSDTDTGSDLPLPPGSMGLPFIGETLSLVWQGGKFSTSRHAHYGDVFKTHILGRPTIRVRGATNVRKILLGENHIVTSLWPQTFRTVLGTGNLAMSNGEEHRLRRKVIMKAFNYEALERYVPIMQEILRESVLRWCGAPQPVTVWPMAREMAFRVASAVLVGFQHSDEEIQHLTFLFTNMVKNLFSLPVKLPGSGLSNGLFYREAIDKWMMNHIQRKKEFVMQGGDSGDVLSHIMNTAKDNGEKLSDQEIQDTVVELLFAGHETTSSAATSLIMHLALQPQVVQKVQEELEKHGLLQPDQPLSLEQVGRLTYVGQVVKEVLRRRPPIGGGYRRALKSFEIGGFQVPEGWAVLYSIRDTHEASQIFSSPELFDPDRWTAETSQAPLARYDMVTFGGGPRACVGKEFAKLQLKLLCVELTRRCRWKLTEDKAPDMKFLPIVYPADGLPVIFTPIGGKSHGDKNKNGVLHEKERTNGKDSPVLCSVSFEKDINVAI
ncbi:cytochrome P450 26A1-like [Branchiostoma floridae x Branchiostoma belcheri]